ncbi:hypothetical protein FO519_004252 [Halicephalobus sp. NKZ332]|nr:hypothetical protein FO519_004252 [Halicephalobus sp. NKZ332]
MILWLILLLSPVFAWWYHSHLKSRNMYFLKKGIPSPPIKSLFLGHLKELQENEKPHEKLLEWKHVYGDTFGIFEGAHRVIVTSDPELLHLVLIKEFNKFHARKMSPGFALDQATAKRLNVINSQGLQWKRLRALTSQILTVSRIKSIEPIIHNVLHEFREEISTRREGTENNVIDVFSPLTSATFATISRSAISETEKFGHSEMFEKLIRPFAESRGKLTWREAFFSGTYDFLFVTKYLFTIVFFLTAIHFVGIIRRLNKVCRNREKQRQSNQTSPDHPTDFVDFLLDAEIDEKNLNEIPGDFTRSAKIEKKLTRKEIISTLTAFLVTGTATTADSTAFAFYELAKCPNFQKKILEEMRGKIEHDRDLTYSNVQDLIYLDAFVKEVLRFYPVGQIAIARRCVSPVDVTLRDGRVIHIDAGTCVAANVQAVHFDPSLWDPDVNEFKPDRFLEERSLLMDHPNVTQRRRTTGSAKLTQLFSKDSESERLNALLHGLEDLSVVSRLASRTADAQKRGSDQLARWAHKSRNAAIDDVMQKSTQIFHMFADKQAQFARDYEHFLAQLRKIMDTEKLVKECEGEVKILIEKEKKLRKELNKGGTIFTRRKSSDILLLKEQLDRAIMDRQLAERRLDETRTEAEVIKMFRFRHGMMGIADSYRNLASNCQAMFDCQREIAEMVPAVSTQDVNRMFYEGIPYTRDRLENLRRSLDNEIPLRYNPPTARRSEPGRNMGFPEVRGTPPPPYTPTAPPQSDLEDSMLIQRRVVETPRTRRGVTQRVRSQEPHTRVAACESSSSSSSSSDESTPSPSTVPQRLYPSLDEPDSAPCPLKEFGLRPAYGVH